MEALLVRLGLGPLDRDTLSAPPGRNQVWVGETPVRKVFVKRLVGAEPDVRSRMARLMAFQRFAASLPPGSLRVPELLGCDPEAGIVVFEGVDGAVSGASLMVDEEFGEELSRLTGEALGLVHAATPPADTMVTEAPPIQPSVELLEALPSVMFDQLSFGELQAWQLMQGDPELARAVAGLRRREQMAPKVPAHCDFRVDQLLVADGTVLISDWEEFRLADPARDVGGFAGEWLYRSVLDIVTTRGGAEPIADELTHETVIQRGAASLERLRPHIEQFWRGYVGVRGETVDGELAERATAFAGWHLLDRLLAGSSRTSKLSGIERAAAGIGRTALLSPDRFASAIGLGRMP
ncbi:hypothetical protein GCM10027294_09940 [Marinactinospora endophytica]